VTIMALWSGRNQLSMAFGRKRGRAATNKLRDDSGCHLCEGVYPDVRRFSVNFMPADMDFSEQFLRMDEIIGRREGGRPWLLSLKM